MRIRIIGALVALVLAVVGGVVIYLYVQSADRRAQAGAEFQQVYIVTERIPAGSTPDVVRESVEVEELPALAIQPDIVTSFADLEGLVTSVDLLPGEQLRDGRFIDPASFAAEGNVPVPEGLQELTVALEVERVVGGAVTPGAQVGVVVTDPSGTTQFVFHRVLVTRVQPGDSFVSDSDSDESGPVSTIMVTFALSTPDAEKVVWAAERQQDGNAGIWLTLQNELTSTDGSRPVDANNVRQ